MPNTQTSDADITHAYDDGGGEAGEDMVEDLADALVSFQPREWGVQMLPNEEWWFRY